MDGNKISCPRCKALTHTASSFLLTPECTGSWYPCQCRCLLELYLRSCRINTRHARLCADDMRNLCLLWKNLINIQQFSCGANSMHDQRSFDEVWMKSFCETALMKKSLCEDYHVRTVNHWIFSVPRDRIVHVEHFSFGHRERNPMRYWAAAILT